MLVITAFKLPCAVGGKFLWNIDVNFMGNVERK